MMMAARGSTRVAQIGAHFFSAATVRYVAKETTGAAGVFSGASSSVEGMEKVAGMTWTRFPMMGGRLCSTWTVGEKEQKEVEKEQVTGSAGGEGGKAVVSYWGVEPPKITKEDGTI